MAVHNRNVDIARPALLTRVLRRSATRIRCVMARRSKNDHFRHLWHRWADRNVDAYIQRIEEETSSPEVGCSRIGYTCRKKPRG